jgi:hypothetical protein
MFTSPPAEISTAYRTIPLLFVAERWLASPDRVTFPETELMTARELQLVLCPNQRPYSFPVDAFPEF